MENNDNSKELLHYALEYFDKYHWGIHPLVPKDKKPVCDNWSRWSHELPTRQQIINWWEENPEYNIGLVTGRASGVLVLDIDLQTNPNAVKELEELTDGKKIVCPFVWTPGGGKHAYFSYPEGANIGCTSIGVKGIDTRGNGGNIVLPPSIHPNGKRYRWNAPLEDRDLPPLPDAIVAKLDKDRPAPKPRTADAKLNPNDLLSVMMDKCAFCRKFTPNTGDLHEELWYRWLTQMVCYEGGAELAYELSSGSPKFDDKTTQKKIIHAEEALAKGLAPYRCDEIIGCEGWTSEECNSCIAYRRQSAPAGLPYILRSLEMEKERAGIYDITININDTPDEPIPDEVLAEGVVHASHADEAADEANSQKQKNYVTEPIDESDIDTTPALPMPELPDSVWRGWFSKYRELMSPTTEASDAYHLAGFLTTVGALLGRSVMVNYAGDLYPNIYTVLEGRTGISRKSSAIKSATKTIRDVDPTLIIRRGLSTVEGIINLLRSPTEEEMEDYAAQVKAYKDGIIYEEPEEPAPVFDHEGRRLLVVLDEFAHLLKKARQETSSTLIQGLTDAYDMPDRLDNPTKVRPMSANKPCISLVGLTTKAWLERSLDYDDLLGGFVNRFIFFVGEPKDPKPLPPEPDALLWNTIKTYLQHVRQAHHKDSLKEHQTKKYTLTPEAFKVWDDYYRRWHRAQKEADDETMACLWQRLPNHAMKTALVYGALEDKTGKRQITADQIQAGIDLATYAEKSYEYLFHSFGFSKRSRVEAVIVEKLQQEQMTKTELRYSISSAISTRELNEGIRDLMQIGRIGEKFIKVEDSIGRTRSKRVLVLLKR